MAVALLMGAAAFTSCSKDDDPVIPVIDATVTTYTVKQGEQLTITPQVTSLLDGATYEWIDSEGKVLSTTPSVTLDNKVCGLHYYQFKVKNANDDKQCASQIYSVTVEQDLVTVDFEGDYWTALIDTPQYGGPLLYGTDSSTPVNYSWTDPQTQLSSKLTAVWGGYYGYSEGGIAISNYVDADIKNHNNYNYQLAVPVSNGSKNFAVAYCEASMTFADGKARYIESIDMCPTTYALGVCKYGDGYAASLAESGYLTLNIIGILADDTEKNLINIDLASKSGMMEDWITLTFNVFAAGGNVKVKGLKFTMTGSDSSEYGLNTPAYFALDNIVVDNYTE